MSKAQSQPQPQWENVASQLQTPPLQAPFQSFQRAFPWSSPSGLLSAHNLQPHSIVRQDAPATPLSAADAHPTIQMKEPNDSSTHSVNALRKDEHSGQAAVMAHIRDMYSEMLSQQAQHTEMMMRMMIQHSSSMGAASASMQRPILIQNRTDVCASAQQSEVCQNSNKSETHWIPHWLSCLLRPRINQIVILCGALFVTYAVRERCLHRCKIAQIQARINSNVILRFVKTFEDAFGLSRLNIS